MNREVHVRLREGLRVKFPRATRPLEPKPGYSFSGEDLPTKTSLRMRRLYPSAT